MNVTVGKIWEGGNYQTKFGEHVHRVVFNILIVFSDEACASMQLEKVT